MSKISIEEKKIHPTALVDPKAILGENVEVGPYTIIEEGAIIGKNSKIKGHVYISSYTKMGENCVVHHGAILGTEPQDMKFSSSTVSYLNIGNFNVIREYVTLHRASQENQSTSIGNENLFMVQSHVGHDCIIGSNNTIANAAMLAGHVTIEDFVFVSGGVPIHQFVRVGQYAMLSGWSAVSMDVPPFMIAQGPNTVRTLNMVGLTRANIPKPALAEIRLGHKILYRSNLSVSEALEQLRREEDTSGYLKILIDFVTTTKRGICRPPKD